MNELKYLIKGWEEFNSKVYLLEKDYEYSLYQVFSEYEQNHKLYRNAPVYFIFYKEDEILNTTDYLEAYICYRKCIGENYD